PRIISTSSSGTGCPSSHTTVTFNNDWDEPVLQMRAFEARYPGFQQSTTFCQLHLQGVGVDPGWQFAVKNVWTTGHLILSRGATLEYYLTTYFSQNAAYTRTQHVSVSNNVGNSTIDRYAAIHIRVPDGGEIWSPCTDSRGYAGLLNINFRVALLGGVNGTQTGYFGKGTRESVTEEWQYAWRRC
ncbi:uncharacterized protein BCR38DRAFT_309362, partial [Pseudomassariella vexata]